jgi:ATP-dependent Clp protease ATP-binding subunit ClpA
VSESARAVDEATMRVGLLMESAQAHQKMAETHLERLRAHTQDLDEIVREEIRRTLIEELQSLTAESKRAMQALSNMKRAANMRGLLWSAAIAVLCTAIPSVIARWVLPSASEISTLRAEREQLAMSVARLKQQGGLVNWRYCGEAGRLCVRVDRNAPTYGEKADYFVVRGY